MGDKSIHNKMPMYAVLDKDIIKYCLIYLWQDVVS